MSRYVLTPSAKADLVDIFEYIRFDKPKAAKRVIDKIREAIRRLARTPNIGHVREDLADKTIRFWPVHSYLIVYRPETRPLQVLRVLHGARDVRRILERVP